MRLIIHCKNLFEQREQHPEGDFYSAFLFFSEPIGVADTLVRYRFDDGDPFGRTLVINDRGRAIALTTIKENDDFIVPLAKSSKVRVQLDLPYPGNTVVNFDAAGALQAMSKLSCHDKRAR